MDKSERRLRRQVDAFTHAFPAARGAVAALVAPNRRWVRVPLALALILGGLLAILPVLGLWMLPLGLLLLAVDLPALRPSITGATIRARRGITARGRKRRQKRAQQLEAAGQLSGGTSPSPRR